MFTGLVQTIGAIDSLEGMALTVDLKCKGASAEPFEIGESVAVNGCCLTVVEIYSILLEGDTPGAFDEPGPTSLRFDLSQETLRRTNLGMQNRGDLVNIERAMRASDRFGGHIVQGHVDAIGKVVSVRREGEFTVFRFSCGLEYDRYLIDKGSVAVDGISLTVVEPHNGEFEVWIIPHTLTHTNLGTRRPGDPVNLEFDVLAKHTEKLLQHLQKG